MHKHRHKVVGFVLALLVSTIAIAATPVVVNPTHPERYVVQKGDTLWDIASKFLRDPWRWPDIWQVNPQVENPHLIYPGDELSLTYADGRPLLSLRRGGERKLSPQVRREPLDAAIPAIPMDAIKQFLSRQFVAEKDELNTAPYVVDFAGEHIAGSAGETVYVRSILDESHIAFDIVRPGRPYIDPVSGEVLAYEARYVGSAELEKPGDPAKLFPVRTALEVLRGDRVIPDVAEIPLQAFHPKAPDQPVEGFIISVLNGVNQIGQYNTVVLNLGEKDGMQRGDVLKIYQGGFRAPDRVRGAGASYVRPLEEAGVLMVYRTFSRVSLALVMYAQRPLHVLDVVKHPEI